MGSVCYHNGRRYLYRCGMRMPVDLKEIAAIVEERKMAVGAFDAAGPGRPEAVFDAAGKVFATMDK